MKRTWGRLSVLGAVLACAGSLATGQSSSGYDARVAQGTALLQAGQPDRALAAGQAAIGQSPERWDGYALAGRSLLALKRYEAAADALSEAIERAPSEDQGPLRQWRRDALLAESGYPVPGEAAAVAAPPAPAVASAPPVPPPAPAAPAPQVAPSPPAPPAPLVPPAPVARVVPDASSSPVSVVMPDPASSPSAVWVDGGTGLMWARPWYYPASARGPWSYTDAAAFCSRLQLLGYGGWRLPTLQEVQQVYLPSSKAWRWSKPRFAAAYGVGEALDEHIWRLADFTVEGDNFNGNRLLIWSSTPGNGPGEHEGVYFGRAYSVKDEAKMGMTLRGAARDPFHAYAFCVRSVR